MIYRKDLFYFIFAFVFFAGTNCGHVPIIGVTVKLLNNLFFLYMLLDLINLIFKKNLPKFSFVTAVYIFYVMNYVIMSMVNHYDINDMLLSLMKSIVVFMWFDKEIMNNGEILTGPVMWALISWCLLDSFITFVYPGGAPFLAGGYVLGWKNNKLMHLFSSNLLLAFNFLKKKNRGLIDYSYVILWGGYLAICANNARIIASSTTLVVLSLLIIYLIFTKLINSTILVNGYFVFIFHVCCFFLLIFVRELFQDSLDSLMKLFFNKDATFTGRIYIWRAALMLIPNAFLLGSGNFPYQPAPLDNGFVYYWKMAHNQILQCMMEGGLILTTLWVVMVFRVLITNHRSTTNYSKMAIITMFAFLFFFQTEAALTMMAFFIFYILNYIGDYRDEESI